MDRFLQKIKSVSSGELKLMLKASNGWEWPACFGEKPFLYDYLANYPKQATIKKRLWYLRDALVPHLENGSLRWEQMSRFERRRLLLASVSPVYRSTFLEPRRTAIKKELYRRGAWLF